MRFNVNRLTISVPEKMSEFVDSQIATGRYGNVSEYFRDLVRRDQDQREKALKELGALLDKARNSGISNLSFDEIMEEARREARAKGLLND